LVLGYIIAQILGAMMGGWVCYLIYIDHYLLTENEGVVRSTFCTGPAIRNFKNNFFSEFIGTFVLVFGVMFIAAPNIEIEGMVVENFGLGALQALPVAILVWVIGIALGGTTGYAINPARDFGPRLMYQMLPRKNKDADWSYAWIPVLGPLAGGALAGFAYTLLVNIFSIFFGSLMV
jgi:glycerol uptake facilitator protein